MISLENKKYLEFWAERYKNDLTEDILPFWLKYGLDKVNGGFYTSVDRDGTLMDTTKSVWFQGRAGFIFAYAYNQIDKRPEYLEASKSAIDFIEKYCFDTDGRMFFEITADGKPLRKRRYLFSETFAAIAMAEYSIATGIKEYAEKALGLFKLIQKYDATPGLLEPKYMDTQPMHGHSLCMIMINTASRVRAAIKDPILDKQINDSIASIVKLHMKPEFEALLETVGANGEFIDTAIGRTINPGHSLETSWFIMAEAEHRNWDEELVKQAITIFDWSWKWGWDEEFGGIINFKDCKNFPHQDYSQDMKFWWPQNETIIASLYAYLATKDESYLDKYRQINDWTYKHFPDSEHGEWYGYLHRNCSVAQPAKGNMFKGPFHIPRMMIIAHQLCKAILD